MIQSTADMLYDQVRSSARLLDEVWDAIEGKECETCDGTGKVNDEECEDCDGSGEVTTYEGQDAREYLDEMPLEIVWTKGEPFAVVLSTGGPHIEVTGGGLASGTAYIIEGYWTGEHATWYGQGVTKTGEYFRELMEEQDEIGRPKHKEATDMIATVANMKKVQNQASVLAYSPITGEEYSANPHDYWDVSDDTCLKDETGEPMILVRKRTIYEEIAT